MSSKQQIVSGLVLVALALEIAAIATPNWGSSSGLTIGLWKSCLSGGQCVQLPMNADDTFPKNSLHAVRAFCIMSAVFLFLSICPSAHMPLDVGGKSKALMMAGGVSALLAMVIWLAEFSKLSGNKITPAYSFYLNVGAAICALGAVGYAKYY